MYGSLGAVCVNSNGSPAMCPGDPLPPVTTPGTGIVSSVTGAPAAAASWLTGSSFDQFAECPGCFAGLPNWMVLAGFGAALLIPLWIYGSKR